MSAVAGTGHEYDKKIMQEHVVQMGVWMWPLVLNYHFNHFRQRKQTVTNRQHDQAIAVSNEINWTKLIKNLIY